MAKYIKQRTAASNMIGFAYLVQDTTGENPGFGKTGLTYLTSGLKISVRRELSSAATVYSSGASTVEDITTLGTYAAPSSTKIRFKEVDATNFPGLYEIHFAQALLGTADTSRILVCMVACTGCLTTVFEMDLGTFDFNSLTAASGAIEANVTQVGGSNIPTPAVDGVPIVDTKYLNGAATIDSLTPEQFVKIVLSFIAGKATGGGTTSLVFRDVGDTTDRITMTVDSSGNRSSVVLVTS